MKRNVLLLLSSFTALLWSCGSQSLRTSIADDGLYFDPKIEERLNQAKAAERAAKAEELKSATEAALAQKNQPLEQAGNTSEIIQQGGGTLYQIQDNQTDSNAVNLSGTSSTREESRYAKSFIFDDPTVVVLYRDPWSSPWYSYGPSWSIGWNWSTRWGFRPYWNAGIYWGWNSWYDPFWSGWYDPWYGYGYGGWYGYPHYGHHHYPIYAGRPYSNTKRNRVGGSNNNFGGGSYMGIDSYSSGYRRPGSTTTTTQTGNTARPNTSAVNPGSSSSTAPVNPNNYRRPAGTGSNNTTVNTDVTKNESGNTYRRPSSSGSGVQRPMTVPVGSDNNSGSGSSYRRPTGSNNGTNNKGTSPTQVYTRPSVSHDAYNNTSRGSSPASENLRRRSSDQNDANSTRTETNAQNRRNREYNNNEYNTSPKNVYPNGGSTRNTAPSSGGNNQSTPPSGGNRRR